MTPPSSATAPPPTLTAAQTRALLQTLLSTVPSNSNSPNSAVSSKPARQPHAPTQQPQRRHKVPQCSAQPHTITIDTSTRIMGHCNTIHFPPPSSPGAQALRLEELVRGILAGTPNASGGLNINVQAGVNVMGSRNVMVFGAGAPGSVRKEEEEEGKTEGGCERGKKRGADENDDMMAAKKVKLEV